METRKVINILRAVISQMYIRVTFKYLFTNIQNVNDQTLSVFRFFCYYAVDSVTHFTQHTLVTSLIKSQVAFSIFIIFMHLLQLLRTNTFCHFLTLSRGRGPDLLYYTVLQ